MTAPRQCLRRLRALFQRRQLEAEMAEEMQLHLDHRVREHLAGGLSAEEARYRALRQFGGIEQIKESVRDQRGWRWLEEFVQDLRHAFRQLRKAPGHAGVAVF